MQQNPNEASVRSPPTSRFAAKKYLRSPRAQTLLDRVDEPKQQDSQRLNCQDDDSTPSGAIGISSRGS